MESSVLVRDRFLSGGRIFADAGGQGFSAGRLVAVISRCYIVFEHEVVRAISDKNGATVVGLGVLNVITKASRARAGFRGLAMTKTIEKILRRNGVTIGPTRVCSQMKGVFRGVSISFPAFRNRRAWQHVPGPVFNQPLEEGHVNAGFRLACAHLRIQ